MMSTNADPPSCLFRPAPASALMKSLARAALALRRRCSRSGSRRLSRAAGVVLRRMVSASWLSAHWRVRPSSPPPCFSKGAHHHRLPVSAPSHTRRASMPGMTTRLSGRISSFAAAGSIALLLRTSSPPGRPRHRHGCNGASVMRGIGIGVEHRQKVAARLCVVANPDKQVRTLLCECHGCTEQHTKGAADLTHYFGPPTSIVPPTAGRYDFPGVDGSLSRLSRQRAHCCSVAVSRRHFRNLSMWESNAGASRFPPPA